MWLTSCLLLCILISRVAGAYDFFDRTALLAARDAWCASPTTAAQTYGPIGEWSFVAVTDLTWLFCASSSEDPHCNADCSTFNEELNSWDVGSVTDMRCALPRRATHARLRALAFPLLMRRPSELRVRCGRVACTQTCSSSPPPLTAM